jgi:parallel beta-helix repeat protein
MKTTLGIWTGIAAAVLGAGVLAIGESRATATAAISCGMVVTTSITASNNITNCAGDGLVVGANNITINLNGHVIDGDDSGDEGIDNLGGFDNVKVMNGRITDFGYGVFLENGADQNTINGLEIRSNEFGIAISSDSDLAIVKDNRVLLNTDDGIIINGSLGHIVESNRVVQNVDNGIDAGTQNTVLKNVVARNGGVGILLHNDDGSTLDQNVVTGNGGIGIVLNNGATGNVVSLNRVVINTGGGILLDSNGAPANSLLNNLVYGNPAQGIAVLNTDGTMIKQNDIVGSTNDNIFIDGSSGLTVLDRNKSISSGEDGIDIDDAGGGTLIKRNVADANADRGIEAVSGIDGGGNKAAGNQGAQQCQVVACS